MGAAQQTRLSVQLLRRPNVETKTIHRVWNEKRDGLCTDRRLLEIRTVRAAERHTAQYGKDLHLYSNARRPDASRNLGCEARAVDTGRLRYPKLYRRGDDVEQGFPDAGTARQRSRSFAFRRILGSSARSLMYNDVVDAMFRFTTAERDRYGNTGFGNACIVARNIAKADLGARFITIMHGGW